MLLSVQSGVADSQIGSSSIQNTVNLPIADIPNSGYAMNSGQNV